jgi:hypothetical protein
MPRFTDKLNTSMPGWQLHLKDELLVFDVMVNRVIPLHRVIPLQARGM